MAARLLIGLAFLLAWHAPAQAERRVALVLGNSTYQSVPRLPNPANDAQVIARLLKDAGFEVETRLDFGISDFRRLLRDFNDKVEGADIAVVYFAGHGIEVGGTNYLVPTDARLLKDGDVEDEAISLDRVLRTLDPAKKLRLVFLDACRENPFVAKMRRLSANRSVGRGLARVEPEGSDTLVAYATKAGALAADGDSRNSPYANALSKHLLTPGLDIRLALGRVRDEVLSQTRRQQEPYYTGSLGGAEISLARPQPLPPSTPRAPEQEPARPVANIGPPVIVTPEPLRAAPEPPRVAPEPLVSTPADPPKATPVEPRPASRPARVRPASAPQPAKPAPPRAAARPAPPRVVSRPAPARVAVRPAPVRSAPSAGRNCFTFNGQRTCE